MNILKNIWYLLQTSNVIVGTFAIIIMISIIILTFFHKKCMNDKKKMKIWRICALIPLIIAIIHFFIFCIARKCTSLMFSYYSNIYIPVCVILLWIIFANKEKIYRYITVVIYLVTTFCFIYTFLTLPNISNFFNMSYTESFKSMISKMQDENILNDWKEIDYNEIEREIYPLVEEAEKNNDKIAYAEALMKYVYKFYDGHVDIAFDSELEDKIYEKVAGNDYGFSMITLEDGKTIAILVEEDSEAYNAGIQDGIQITKWNGIDIELAKENVECYLYGGIPVKENEDFLKPLYLAGMGADKIEVTFIDYKNEEKTIELNTIGSYKNRLDLALEKLLKANDENENFYTTMLNKECGYLKIEQEFYNWYDDIAYLTENHFLLRNMLIQKLDKLEEEGMKNLIIDLRCNGGGLEIVSREVASLFADKEYFATATGYMKNGEYIKIANQYIKESGKYKNINVVVLVNLKCISSGDIMANYLNKLPNVTVMGITEPNGSAQALGGFCMVSDGIAGITYPTGLSLDENKEPFIDTAKDRISRNSIDKKIPLTQDAAIKIFIKNQDYELDYAIEFFNQREN